MLRLALVGVLISSVAVAADGGVAKLEVIHRRDAGVYLVPDEAWNALDTELKRLQHSEHLPKPVAVDPEVQGYLIGMAITGAVFLAAGVALGYVARDQVQR